MDNINILSSIPELDEEVDDAIDNLSTMTDDYSNIRNGIEDLLQDINAF